MVLKLFRCFITARRSYVSAVLGVVILSACLSLTRVFRDKTKQCIKNKSSISIELENVAIIAMYCHLRPTDAITFPT